MATQLRIDGGEDLVGANTRRTDHMMTPPWVCDFTLKALRTITLDPCSHAQSIVPASRRVLLPENGLEVPRQGERCYTNCPFSNPLPWAELFGQAAADLFLIRIDTTTQWWRILWERSSVVVLLDRRIAFGIVDEAGAVNWESPAMWSCAVFGAGDIRPSALTPHGYVAKRTKKPRSVAQPEAAHD